MTGVISSLTGCRDKVTFKVKGDDLLFVSLSTANQLDVPTSGQLSAIE